MSDYPPPNENGTSHETYDEVTVNPNNAEYMKAALDIVQPVVIDDPEPHRQMLIAAIESASALGACLDTESMRPLRRNLRVLKQRVDDLCAKSEPGGVAFEMAMRPEEDETKASLLVLYPDGYPAAMVTSATELVTLAFALIQILTPNIRN